MIIQREDLYFFMNRFSITILLFFLVFSALATHERAGEIVYTHVSGLTYEVKIITYTYSPSPADRPELEISWGDGTTSILPRSSLQDLTPVIRRNEYTGQHTYAGGGTFNISVEDPNRNYGIVNIPNSVNIPFFIQTQLVINPFLGSNNSVVLLNPPLDYGCVNRLYIHNPGAYDPDGDSISYKLTVCRGAGGLPIPGYSLPSASNEFSIDEITGDLIWDKPLVQGEYNVAFIIEEWRSGVRIGYVTRDLQIKIDACNNDPPEIFTIDDTCVVAGTDLTFPVTAEDPNGHKVLLSASGGPFLQEVSPAVMDDNPAIGNGSVTTNFNWSTQCEHVKKNPYSVFFKAFDDSAGSNSNNFISLSSYKTVSIQVVAPAVELIQATPLGNSIQLAWNQTECENAKGYVVYRNTTATGFVPGHCETGVPSYTGYVEVARVNGIQNTEFTDDDDGRGLVHGVEYCYLITVFFQDGAESYASNELCAYLKKDVPVITNVSVERTNLTSGEMYVAWSKPTELDTIEVPGPYKYKILRRDNSAGSQFTLLTTYFNLNDTLFVDSLLNTRDLQYRYRIDLYAGEDETLVGSTVVAPSIYLQTAGTDRVVNLAWNDDVPWYNEQFVIYRQNEVTMEFDSIAMTDEPFYADTGLINGKLYCYKVKTIGAYAATGIVDPIINFSQVNCGVPVDNVPPCIPELTVETNCLDMVNELSWTYPDSCTEERLKFFIFYAGISDSDYLLIDSTDYIEPENTSDYTYTFITTPPSVVGCFTITALDSLRNQSEYSNVECVDINECGRIWFPAVLTPNGDGANDFFSADSINSIREFRLKIFNRWGTIVYETEDPYFKWYGKDEKNNRDCSPGTYFYEGTVSEYTLRGPVMRAVRGTVTLLR